MPDSLNRKCDPSLLALLPEAGSASKVDNLAPLATKRALVLKRRIPTRPARAAKAGLRRVAAGAAPPRSATVAKAVVFVECSRADSDVSCDDAHDVHLNAAKGRVRTAYLPLTSLAHLAAQEGVRRIVAARRLRRCLDKALPAVKVPSFKKKGKLSGKGVIVGIIDSGIDGKHTAFQRRIHRVWDQTRKGKGVKEGDYGIELHGAGVSKAVDDYIGHGTHVAGIAASSDEKYRGVAHEALLVVVRTTFEDAHILDGIRYIFRVAGDLGLPAVVNLSIGGHWDAHDGSDPLSRGINEQVGPGRIVCCSAGNEGTDNIHVQARIPAGKDTGFRFTIPEDTATTVTLNLRYESPHHALEVSIRSPGGEATPWQPVVVGGNPSRRYKLGADRVQVATGEPEQDAPESHAVLVELSGGKNTESPLREGAWEVRLRNVSPASTRLDAWIIDELETQECFFSGLDHVLDNMKIGSPGASAAAITVAAFTTRRTWPMQRGGSYTDSVTIGEIAPFSSEGPLRNGKRKPDVAAPGQWLVSTRARQAVKRIEENVSRRFLAMQGTSMACPFVTGLVALLLQRNPKLTPKQARQLLVGAASIPGKAPGAFDPSWGFGLVDASRL